ncbi:uncharacterized protein LOC115359644 [Myripristis murdjan]|uniref:uncharacterized protein LOC115359644 n=1 Tax=Myripristis murdjan TaxID=586833 RepID=UPI00117649C6|nr:uncharacterized protein LOC115359644 [Myripristis murdjan]
MTLMRVLILMSLVSPVFTCDLTSKIAAVKKGSTGIHQPKDTTMESFVISDMNSFECMSPSELDKNFFGEQSLPSALSLEQLSSSRVSNDLVVEGSEAKPCALPSLCLLSDSMSPSKAFPVSSSTCQESQTPHLTVPLQGNSSTPHELLQKEKLGGSFDQQCYIDLMATQISWDVSLIKPNNNSPKLCMESSSLESTWSPKPQSVQGFLAETSSPTGQESPITHI